MSYFVELTLNLDLSDVFLLGLGYICLARILQKWHAILSASHQVVLDFNMSSYWWYWHWSLEDAVARFLHCKFTAVPFVVSKHLERDTLKLNSAFLPPFRTNFGIQQWNFQSSSGFASPRWLINWTCIHLNFDVKFTALDLSTVSV